MLELEPRGGDVAVGETRVRFLPGGPDGRPELVGEVIDE